MVTLATLVAVIQLTLAGHQVPTVCVSPLNDMGVTTSQPQLQIELNTSVCHTLETLLKDPTGTKLHYSHPAKRDWYEAYALLTVIHESEHVAQFQVNMPMSQREQDAECVAVRDLPPWLELIGVPEARRVVLEQDAAKITSLLPEAYRGCGITIH